MKRLIVLTQCLLLVWAKKTRTLRNYKDLPCNSTQSIEAKGYTQFMHQPSKSEGECSFLFQGADKTPLEVTVQTVAYLDKIETQNCSGTGKISLFNMKRSGKPFLEKEFCGSSGKAEVMRTRRNAAMIKSSMQEGTLFVSVRADRSDGAREIAGLAPPVELDFAPWSGLDQGGNYYSGDPDGYGALKPIYVSPPNTPWPTYRPPPSTPWPTYGPPPITPRPIYGVPSPNPSPAPYKSKDVPIYIYRDGYVEIFQCANVWKQMGWKVVCYFKKTYKTTTTTTTRRPKPPPECFPPNCYPGEPIQTVYITTEDVPDTTPPTTKPSKPKPKPKPTKRPTTTTTTQEPIDEEDYSDEERG